jgi:hypothetical protein
LVAAVLLVLLLAIQAQILCFQLLRLTAVGLVVIGIRTELLAVPVVVAVEAVLL